MALSQAVAAPIEEILGSVELAPRNGFHLEPRCHVCRNDEMRTKVNGMLAAGASYAMILRAVEDDNTKLEKRDQITIDSIRNHTARHYPVQNVAKATYREILERRAKENGINFVEGLATAITPMAFYETVMARGYETLVDSDTKVDVNTGMIAAGRLQALIESRASATSMVDMWVKMDRIINAIKSTVPESMWPEIVRKMKGKDEAPEPLEDDEVDVFDPGDDPFDDELDE
jgi:lambda repressor-like predicted transcriptional regulator